MHYFQPVGFCTLCLYCTSCLWHLCWADRTYWRLLCCCLSFSECKGCQCI